MSEKDEQTDEKSLLGRKASSTVIGVLLFGVIGSAMYDFFVKPGINIFSETIFNLLTLGSQQVKDFSFKTAALDPTSIPSLLLLITASTAAIIYALNSPINALLKKSISKLINPLNSKKPNVFIRSTLVVFLAISLFSAIFIPMSLYNQSVLIWRVFNANVEIVSPAISELSLKKLKSKFASMESKSDYHLINEELEAIATKNNMKLRSEKPW